MGYYNKTYKYDLGKICGHQLSVEIVAQDDEEAEKQIYLVKAMLREAFKTDQIKYKKE